MTARAGIVLDHQGMPVEEALGRARAAEEMGAAGVWLVQLPNQRESSIVLAGLACRTRRCTVASAIMPFYTRPPVVAASSALTLDELCGGRLIFGVGLGHRGVGEWTVGAGAAPPAVAGMREYLQIVTGLIRDGEVEQDGKWFSGHACYPPDAPRRPGLPVYLGGFGRRMIELAGELADGVILWMCTPGYIRDHAMPALRDGWARRTDGRYRSGAGFGVTVMLNAVVTERPEAELRWYQRFLTAHLRVPAYQRLFTLSGFTEQASAGRADDVMAAAAGAFGPPGLLRRRMADYMAAGASQIAISPVGSARDDRERFLQTVRGGLG